MICYYLRTIPERFGMRDPYVRDVPGWIAEYVCTTASLGVLVLYIYDVNNIHLINGNFYVVIVNIIMVM